MTQSEVHSLAVAAYPGCMVETAECYMHWPNARPDRVEEIERWLKVLKCGSTEWEIYMQRPTWEALANEVGLVHAPASPLDSIDRQTLEECEASRDRQGHDLGGEG